MEIPGNPSIFIVNYNTFGYGFRQCSKHDKTNGYLSSAIIWVSGVYVIMFLNLCEKFYNLRKKGNNRRAGSDEKPAMIEKLEARRRKR